MQRKRVADEWRIRVPYTRSVFVPLSDWQQPAERQFTKVDYECDNEIDVFRIIIMAKHYFECLSDTSQLDECLKDSALKIVLIINFLMQQTIREAFALVSGEWERVVTQCRFAIDQYTLAVVKDSVLADWGHHCNSQLHAQRSHKNRSDRREEEEQEDKLSVMIK